MGGEAIHILVVENEEDHAELIRRSFASRSGQVRLTVAYNLGEARRMLSEFVPDLVIADLLLPDGRGTELLPGEREKSPYPVVLMTGYGDEQIAVEAMKAGALDYVVKSETTLAEMPHLAEGILRQWHHIVERKKAEEKLRKSEERFRQVVENAREWIWDVDINGLYTYASAAVEKILGYKPDEIVGKKHFYDLFHPDERQQLKNEAFKCFEQKLPFNEFINKNVHKNGEIVWLSTSGVPLVDEQGELLGYRGADEDITERKLAEEKLFEYQQQLKSLASELLLTEERERRHLAIGLHDNIGQNLALTKLSIQSLMESISDSEILSSLKKICASIDKTIRDSHSLTFELSNPVLYELGFEAAVEEWMKNQIEEKWGIQCKFKVSGGPFQFDSEISVVLFETVRELLINIVKHAKAETVDVEIERAGDRIKILVADDGIGFAATETSLSSSNNKSGGFGLFSIRERLEYLGGDMEIKSLLGEGTRVILSAPINQ